MAPQNDVLNALLAAADRFQIPELVSICAAKLADSITIENAAERLLLAESCHAPALKVLCRCSFFVVMSRSEQKRVFEFFLKADKTRMTQVMDTDAFEKLAASQLRDLMAAMLSDGDVSKKRRRDGGALFFPCSLDACDAGFCRL